MLLLDLKHLNLIGAYDPIHDQWSCSSLAIGVKYFHCLFISFNCYFWTTHYVPLNTYNRLGKRFKIFAVWGLTFGRKIHEPVILKYLLSPEAPCSFVAMSLHNVSINTLFLTCSILYSALKVHTYPSRFNSASTELLALILPRPASLLSHWILPVSLYLVLPLCTGLASHCVLSSLKIRFVFVPSTVLFNKYLLNKGNEWP